MTEVDTRTRVFISYSRTDLAFAQRLRDHLIAAGFDAFLDVHDIVKGEPWRDRLRGLIEGADAVVFLISPDSIASEICEWEVNEAELREKRLLPVIARETPTASIPQRLQRLNFAFLDTEERWRKEGPLLLAALREDAGWLREHTRLGEQALRWERAGRPSRLLLRGADLSSAESWRDRRPHSAPDLSALHLDFLQCSRAGVQRRQRTWLAGISLVALSAVVLSTFAYHQRDLARQNAAVAERRAATLATDVALTRAAEGAVDQGLLMLLDASTRYGDTPVPEKLLLALRDVTREARTRRTFWFPAGARAFHLAGGIAVFDPQDGGIFLIDPVAGDRRRLGDYRGEVVAAALDGAGLYYLTADRGLYRVSTARDAAGTQRLASLAAADGEVPPGDSPTLRLSPAGDPVGLRTRRSGPSGPFRSEFWRYSLARQALETTALPEGLGELVAVQAGAAFFWDEARPRITRLDADAGTLEEVSSDDAAALGIAPCDRVDGRSSPAHLRALYAALRPGLERTGCAGVYGELALLSARRPLARGIMDEYYLFPEAANAEAARAELWLGGAMQRLGTLATTDPFAWYAGSAQAGLVAVAHADRIMVLGPSDARYLEPARYGDADLVVAEFTTPDVTDGGALYGADRLSYSGPDGGRYQVAIVRLDPAEADPGGGFVQARPVRAYWGGCGVQRGAQGDAPRVDERRFVARRDGDATLLDLGDRQVAIPGASVHCASVSARRGLLAAAFPDEVVLFDLPGAGEGPALPLPERLRIPAAGVRTVAFFGADHAALITAHRHKVVAWRPAADGAYVAQTVYRSEHPTLFAEADPTGSRLLVWLGFGTADAMVRVVPLPTSGSDWMQDGPYMLVDSPDVFFGADGAVYRAASEGAARLMPPVSLARLQEQAAAALSPSCRPLRDGDYRSSPCWRPDS